MVSLVLYDKFMIKIFLVFGIIVIISHAYLQALIITSSDSFISAEKGRGKHTLSISGKSIPFLISSKEWPGVIIASKYLLMHIRKVTSAVPELYTENRNTDWEKSVSDNARFSRSTHTVTTPGYHTLKIFMIDPGVVLQKIIVNTGGLKPSYLVPSESYFKF